MRSILENVIKRGGMPMAQVMERIDTMYADGRLTQEERAALIEQMHAGAKPENEKPGWEQAYRLLESRVAALEAAQNQGGAGGEGESETTGDTEIPAWKPYDGVTRDYQQGAVVAHIGKVWKSTYNGQNVWEPGAPGIDERYWVEVVA